MAARLSPRRIPQLNLSQPSSSSFARRGTRQYVRPHAQWFIARPDHPLRHVERNGRPLKGLCDQGISINLALMKPVSVARPLSDARHLPPTCRVLEYFSKYNLLQNLRPAAVQRRHAVDVKCDVAVPVFPPQPRQRRACRPSAIILTLRTCSAPMHMNASRKLLNCSSFLLYPNAESMQPHPLSPISQD